MSRPIRYNYKQYQISNQPPPSTSSSSSFSSSFAMEDKENSVVLNDISQSKIDLKRSAGSPLATKAKKKSRESYHEVPSFNFEQLHQLLVPPTPLETIDMRLTNYILVKQNEVQQRNIQFLELERQYSTA